MPVAGQSAMNDKKVDKKDFDQRTKEQSPPIGLLGLGFCLLPNISATPKTMGDCKDGTEKCAFNLLFELAVLTVHYGCVSK